MSDWPEHGEELARKAMDLLHQKMHAHQNGELTDKELWHVADALADVTQGLIANEEWRVLYAVREGILPKPKRRRA